MSRAFVSEDGPGGPAPAHRFRLPAPDSPEFPAAAAAALLQGAHEGDSAAAEEATGHPFGDPVLSPHVRVLLAAAVRRGDDRLATLARRFLRAAGEVLDDDDA